MRKYSKQTAAIHSGVKRSQFGELSEALYLTQCFAYETAEDAERRFKEPRDDEFVYARYGSPTVSMFEERISAIEGAEAAFSTASGMAAVSGALMAILKAGDHIVSARALFGSCHYVVDSILSKFGVEVTFVNGSDVGEWSAAVRDNTKVLFFESIANPTLELVDIVAVSEIGHSVGAYVVADNAFATPVYSKALEQGADLVCYSATKHIDGQGRAMGGVILGSRKLIEGPIKTFMRHTGGCMSAFNAWIMLKSLETLELRVRTQTANALTLAQTLEGKGYRIIYPGLESHPQHDLCMRQHGAGGTIFSIVLKNKDAAFACLNKLRIFAISNNVGDAKSIATHPSTTTHQRMTEEQRLSAGITPGLLRMSVGLESADDLLADVLGALE
ncbi:MAG TPA: O-succinylhomoserine sulfhydrylase [Bradyrhizobium sp.]|nr:O-succinylhomoserine sulfhydrylase [Bradyrhizobium sp.]